MSVRTLSVIGLGYIGLPTAAVFASRKIKVVGVDVNQKAIDIINEGKIHIVEPDLDIAVHSAVTEGFLKATITPEAADAFIVAVPTPLSGKNKEPDLSHIEAACKAFAPVLKKGDLVILESTSPVGATEQMAEWLSIERPDLTFPQTHNEDSDIRVAHCPERVLPGQVMRELIANDRVVGGMTPKCSKQAVALYKTFVLGECIVTDTRTAEMAKLTENSFRDVNVAFANELSIICDKLNVDVWELISIANRHPRVNILQPGPGVGGHCIAVDPWFIVSKTPREAKLIRTAREVNDSKPNWVIDKLRMAIADFLQANPDKTAKDITLTCYGLTFKPDIDDLRESPAMIIAQEVSALHKGNVQVVEPNIDELPQGLTNATLTDIDTAILTSDIHLLLVDHMQFKIKKPSKGLIVDSRGTWTAC